MNSTSFFPGCYSSRDLNVGANGGEWALYNSERTLKSGHAYNVFMPLPNKDQFLVYDKEVLRQTMLKHESIFRDQVHELHRLYIRQRELMHAVKRRELSKQNLKLQTSQSDSFLPKTSSDSAQKSWQIPSLPWAGPSACGLSISSVENSQSSPSFPEWKSTRAANDAAQTEGDLKNCKLLNSKCKKPKRKMLDLELPADEYIDSEEEDQFGEEKVVAKGPELLYYPLKSMEEFSQKTDLKQFPCGGSVNSIHQAGSSSPDKFSRRTNDLADLNEPIWPEDAAVFNSISFLGSDTYHKSCHDQELSRKSNSGFEVFCKEIFSGTLTGRAVEACLQGKQSEKGKQQELLPGNEEAGQRISNSNSLSQVSSSLSMPFELPAEFPMDLNRTFKSEDKDIKSNQEAGILDINMASCPVLNIGKQCPADDVPVDIIVDSKLSSVGIQFDLNFCINEDESSPALSIPRVTIRPVAEIDLEAPVSPENKECLPPRGESEENHLDTPSQLSKQEDRDQKDELVRMAAEAIVSISTQLVLENTDYETLQDSPHDSLYWFATVVSSMAVDLEGEFGVVLSGKDGGDQQEHSSDGSYYFEAMTLELAETKVEHDWCNSQKGKETGSVLSSPTQPRRVRTRRGRQCKDFQTEVLPSLASLSRHEVTEDLQIIGGLMEAAGFPVETRLGRRNVGRCSRARRTSGNYFCHGEEDKVCSPLKQQNNDSELVFWERSLKGWGKINRRRRGPRIPASNPLHICSSLY